MGRHAAIYRATTDRVCPRPLPGLQCSPFQGHDSNDDVLLASKRRRHSDPTEASAQPGAAGGCESLRAIAPGLEERGIPTARGGKWSAVQVSRLLEAARSPFGASVAVA